MTQVIGFAGYASVFNIVDRQRDLVLPGAFRDSIYYLQDKGVNLLWQHDPDVVLGNISKLEENDFGLYVEGDILAYDNEAGDLFSMVIDRAVSGLSIGYQVISAFTDFSTNIRYLERVHLIEISVVNHPANSAARIKLVDRWQDYKMKSLASEVGRSISILQQANRYIGAL